MINPPTEARAAAFLCGCPSPVSKAKRNYKLTAIERQRIGS